MELSLIEIRVALFLLTPPLQTTRFPLEAAFFSRCLGRAFAVFAGRVLPERPSGQVWE